MGQIRGYIKFRLREQEMDCINNIVTFELIYWAGDYACFSVCNQYIVSCYFQSVSSYICIAIVKKLRGRVFNRYCWSGSVRARYIKGGPDLNSSNSTSFTRILSTTGMSLDNTISSLQTRRVKLPLLVVFYIHTFKDSLISWFVNNANAFLLDVPVRFSWLQQPSSTVSAFCIRLISLFLVLVN